jgi:YbbR domain-containing protein
MWQWIRRNLLSNLTVKLFSIVLALALYLHVFVSQEREIDIDVPFMLHGVPETLTFSEEQLPEMVRVRFRGLGFELLKARSFATGIRLPISVGNSGPGHYHRPLVSEDVIIPRDIEIQVVEIMTPKVISIDFDRLVTRRLPVDPEVVGRPAPGFVKVGAVIVEPDSVGVRGPERRLQSFGMPRAETVNIAGRDAGVAELVGVRVPAGCEAIPPQVTVRVMIEKVISRTFSDLPVEVLHSGNVTLKELNPLNGTVVVTGPSSVVESLTAEEMRLSIDALALLPGNYTLMASVELSRQFRGDAVSVEPVEPEKFEVKLE